MYVDGATGNLVSSVYNGLSWLDANTLETNTSSGSPKIAYFMPEQAVAVWSESTISTVPEWATTTISDAVGTMHLVYATFDGTEWSDPADLDVPAGGDGVPYLAFTQAEDGGFGTVLARFRHFSIDTSAVPPSQTAPIPGEI